MQERAVAVLAMGLGIERSRSGLPVQPALPDQDCDDEDRAGPPSGNLHTGYHGEPRRPA